MSENERINRAYQYIAKREFERKRAEDAKRLLILFILIVILYKAIKG